nr:MAG TPA: hypothetical protein [Caudoviricetes sp.]
MYGPDLLHRPDGTGRRPADRLCDPYGNPAAKIPGERDRCSAPLL